MLFGQLFGLLLPATVHAGRSILSNEFGHHEICGGVYGPEDSKGPFQPEIQITFPDRGDDSDGELALLVFDYEDINNLGYVTHPNGGMPMRKFMCDQEAVYASDCSIDDLGTFVVQEHTANDVLSKKIQITGDDAVNGVTYPVKKTGYYCVGSQPTPGHEGMKYKVNVHFQNAFGHLPGTDYPLILFHFVQCMVYVAVLLVWLIPLIRHRHLVLKVQKYITALAVIMIAEQAIVAAYYFVVNRQGRSAGSKAMLSLVAFWGSARLAYTFFLLMIVACGYSVVHPSLGKQMVRCRLAAGVLFVTGFIYSMLDYYESDSESSNSHLALWSDIMFFPFVLAVGINYFMALNYLGGTVNYLRARKQTAKVSMYRYLSFILVASLLAVLAQSVVLIIELVFLSVKSFIIGYWQYKWVIYDGWPNIVYCVAFIFIMLLWRPSADNMRYAMSTQLAQNEADAEEFEIGSLDGSDDERQNEEFPNDLETRVGARRESVFDAEAHHELSDLEGDFEVSAEDRNLERDEDPLVDAPSAQLKRK